MKVDLKHFDNIIFDLGGVILDIDPERTRKSFLKIITPEQVDKAFASKVFYDFETGSITAQQLRSQLEVLLQTNFDETKFNRAWNAMLLDYKPKRIERIQWLKRSHKLFLLSNTNELHYSCFSDKLINEYGVSFNNLFSKVYLSHKMGLVKPNLEIYRQVLIEQNLIPEKTLFIEDTKENALAAKKLGIEILIIPRNGNFYDYFI